MLLSHMVRPGLGERVRQQLLCWDSEVEEEVDGESETSFEGGQSPNSLRSPSLVDSWEAQAGYPDFLPYHFAGPRAPPLG